MRHATSPRKIAAFAATLIAAAALTAGVLPRSSLHIVREGELHEWWRSDDAPVEWHEPLPAVMAAFDWQPLQPGLDMAEAELVVSRGWLRLRVIAVRLDPDHFTLRLDQRTGANGMTGTWSLRQAPAGAALAVNAGQFTETGPWGWTVLDGRERSYPGRGPLAMAIAADSAGTVHWLPDGELPAFRRAVAPAIAFQSYPVLIDAGGTVPVPLRRGSAIDLAHRDARLAVGRLSDGRILFVLTRFARTGRFLERLPVGLTTPETAALMGALGARPAFMLDGGLSAQLLVRDSTGTVRQWPGSRLVPLALTAIPVR